MRAPYLEIHRSPLVPTHPSIQRGNLSVLVSLEFPGALLFPNDGYLICVTPEKTEGNDSSDALWNGTITERPANLRLL